MVYYYRNDETGQEDTHMKTGPIVVTSQGIGIKEALALTEKLGSDAGLDKKSVLHLRLLAEELFGMLRGIAGEVEANYWAETEGGSFELHMKSEVKMTDDMHAQFLAASSSGKNAAAVSFMGKIRVMIADMLLSSKETLPYAMALAGSAGAGGSISGEAASVWSMAMYRNMVQQHLGESPEASAAWDELEKSIVANIADDVKVSILGANVEIAVYKTL